MDRIESLRIDIEGHIEDANQIRKELWHIGPGLITKMRDRGGFGATSIRQIARESGLSPTYISQCANGKAILSPAAFVTLATMLKEQSEKEATKQ